MNEPTATSNRWKRWFAIGAGFGAGAVVTAFLTTAIVIWYSNQPATARPWNKKAITATYADFYLAIQGQRATFTFRYIVANSTGRDWTLPPIDALYKVLANDKGLERDATLKWDGGPLIPVGQPINIGLQIEYDYTEWTDPPPEVLKQFVDGQLKGIEGFAALDEVNRYDVRFPKPPETK